MSKSPLSCLDPAAALKLVSELKLPGLELETILASQRKNIEALAEANKLSVEGLQTVIRRQAEIIRGGFDEAAGLLRAAAQPQSTAERVTQQTELAKRVVEQSITHARELAEILTRANGEALDILQKRFAASLDDVRDLVVKRRAD